MEMECVVVAGEIQKCVIEAVTKEQCSGGVSCGWNWIGDNAAALTASITAVAAIYIAWWQGRSTMRHNKLSVMPHLHFDKNFKGSDECPSISYVLINHGLGPADITSFEIKINEEVIVLDAMIDLPDRLAEFFAPAFVSEVLDPDGIAPNYQYFRSAYTPFAKDKLAANTPLAIFNIGVSDLQNCSVSLDEEKVMELSKLLEITVKYTSLYGGDEYTETSNPG